MFKRKSFVILLVFLTLPIISFGGQMDDFFPIKPGMEEWKRFTTHSQKTKVLQLPDSNLEIMSTAELLQACLSYPMAFEIMLYNTPQQGIEAVIRQFNGLQEFMKREDAATLLLRHYSGLNPKHLDDSWTLVKKGRFSFKFRYIELLLAQDHLFTKLNPIERRQLLNESIRKFESKKKNPEVFGLLSLSFPTLLMAKVLEKDSPPAFKQELAGNEKLSQFLKTGRLTDTELINQLVTKAKKALEK
jgi:hypothetical protein